MLDDNQGQVPALQRSLKDIVDEYTEKCVGAEAEVAAFHAKVTHMDTISTVGGAFVHGFDLRTHLSASDVKRRLLRSAWRHVYSGLNIGKVATAKDRGRIDLMLENPPEFTVENIREQFGDYLLDPRYHVLRGLAEAFIDLDPAFKSHSKVKIGVKGLPKRVVITGAFRTDSWGGWEHYGGEKAKDVMNALQVYRGLPRLEYAEMQAMAKEAKLCGEADWPGGRVKRFKNGNAHLFFDKDGLLDVNRGLAEFYGEVLPDSPEAEAGEVRKRPGTAVSADLAFYWTPPAVIEEMIAAMPIRVGDRILEPSCGDGRIMDGIVDHVRAKRIENVSLTGIEYDAGRAVQAKAKGHAVLRTNFLECASDAQFSLIYMNPPFAGRHYLRHIEKAIAMLEPGGRLIAVLPASAWFDHEGLPGEKYNPDRHYWGRDIWTDLPLGSFRAAGTNVCTGLWRYYKPAEAQR